MTKEQMREYNAKRYALRREEILKAKKKYRDEHIEEMRAREALRRKSTPENRAKWREFYHENIEKRRKQDAESRARNRDKILKRKAEFRKANKDRLNEDCRRYGKLNPEIRRSQTIRRRAKKKGATIGDEAAIRKWEMSWKKKKTIRCYWCGKRFPTKKCHTDHVIPLSKGGPHSLSNLVVSCSTCNLRKNAKDPSKWNTELKQPLLITSY